MIWKKVSIWSEGIQILAPFYEYIPEGKHGEESDFSFECVPSEHFEQYEFPLIEEA